EQRVRDDAASQVSIVFETLFWRLVIPDTPAEVPGSHPKDRIRCEHSQPDRPDLETDVGRALVDILNRRDLIPIRGAGEPEDDDADHYDDEKTEPFSWRSRQTVEEDCTES